MMWRERCRPIIAKIVRENRGADIKLIRKKLKDAYPWGERAMYPYAVWLDEIKVQLGTKKIKMSAHSEKQLKLF